MPLKNYTTTVDVDKTISEIMTMLRRQGAQAIVFTYKDNEPDGVTFFIDTMFGERGYILPANIEDVFRVLATQTQPSKRNQRVVVPKSLATKAQAARVGWRNVRDWLDAQLAFIETDQVKMEQVLLPFMEWQPGSGVTVFQAMERSYLALPAGNENESDEVGTGGAD